MSLKKNIAIASLLLTAIGIFNNQSSANTLKNFDEKGVEKLYAFLNNSYSWKDSNGNKFVIKKEDCECVISKTSTERTGIDLSPGKKQRTTARNRYRAYCYLKGTKFTTTGFKYVFNKGTSCDEDNHLCRAVNKFGLIKKYQIEADRLNSEENDRQRAFRNETKQVDDLYRELKIRKKLCNNASGDSATLNNNECIYYQILRRDMSNKGYSLPPY
ncbi:hypothetical protein [Prochlorococcus marinus]|uniref:Uncharacterized protein n=1 Tax=Prochlorococcus marinus (strain AS9601) TaxID=146891 RepID=A2BS74_PROMS|nr:hypothetical protein [Prochlorococcus marinus]ABM70635.1 Hypothetical protein A9601_13511 [Prochlorococcus marinus str. AS9601]